MIEDLSQADSRGGLHRSALAARLMDGDPAVRAGVLSYEVHPVRGFSGDSLR